MGVSDLKPAVFFDRDGVLNLALLRDGRPYPPRSVEAVTLDGYARQAIRDARLSGCESVIVTNQPDASRELTTKESIEKINSFVLRATGADAIYSCYHDDCDECTCRKPKPGLLLSAAVERNIDLAESFMIGDRWKDVLAGRAAGCRTIFIDRGYSETPADVGADLVVHSLEGAMGGIRTLLEANHA